MHVPDWSALTSSRLPRRLPPNTCFRRILNGSGAGNLSYLEKLRGLITLKNCGYSKGWASGAKIKIRTGGTVKINGGYSSFKNPGILLTTFSSSVVLMISFSIKMSAMPCMMTKASPPSNGTDHDASEVANQNGNDLLERLGDNSYNKGSR